ncbi:MAG: AAA family ATPase [Desulfurococcales archaeon ex4484_58]|nr:MAG: AAA family ATPase [Desulfurococcales archaeon ex4484_58]
MVSLKYLISRVLNRDYVLEIRPPDLIIKDNNKYYVIRYLIGDEANYSVEEASPSLIKKYVNVYAGLLDKLPEGSEFKVIKKKINLNEITSKISNEIMNLKATIDVVEEPHIKQKAMVKLKILEKLYENIIRGRPITRLNLVIKIRSHGRDLDKCRDYLSSLSNIVKNILYTELGIKLKEASRREIEEIIKYELGLTIKSSLKTIVVETEKTASILPIPRYKKPLMEEATGIPIGYDLETGWPVIIPLKTINKHILVLGPTGRGKTTFLASLVEGLISIGDARVFAIDFKGDLAKLINSDLINIVEPRDHIINILKKPSFFNIVDWSLVVSDVLSNSLKLDHESIVKVLAKIFMAKDLDSVEELILDSDLSILSPIIELLSSKPDYELITKLIQENTLFNLGGYGSAFQNTYGGLLVHLYKKVSLEKQYDENLRVLVIDEAWRISGLRGLLELVKEGRSKGLGVVLATQNPSDVPREIIENCHLIVMFGSVNEDYQRDAQRILGLPPYIINKLSYLGVGEAILLNALDPHPVILKVRTPTTLSGSELYNSY